MSDRYEEICRQPYPNDKYIAAGLVMNDTIEKVYLEFGGGSIIEMRLDEGASIVWALGGALYSALIADTDDIMSELKAENERLIEANTTIIQNNERLMKLAADYIKAYDVLAFSDAKSENLNDHAMSHHFGVVVCDDPDCPWNIEEKEDESAD